MAKLRFFVSPTFVLFFIFAARGWASPIEVIESESQPSAQSEQPPAAPVPDGLAISSPKPGKLGKKAPEAHYYPFHQQFTLRVGKGSRLESTALDENVLGFQYLLPKFLAPKFEVGADLMENGRGHIHVGRRWIFYERSNFRPSLKISADHRIESKDRLATLTDHENYFLRLSGTFEYVFRSPYSLRLEPEGLIGAKGAVFLVTLGISRGW